MINILSFLWDIVNREYSEIGTLVLIILKNSIKQKINKTKNQSFSTFYSIKFKQMKTYNALSGKWPFVLSCMVF